MKSLARVFLLGLTLHSVLSASFTANDWIKIGENFPATSDNDKISQFFYIQSGHNETLKVKEKFLDMSDVDKFRIRLEIWQSNVETGKYVIVRPENKTQIPFNDWKKLDIKVEFKDIANWYTRVFAEENSEMFSALRNLKLDYQNYDPSIDDSKTNSDDTHKVHRPPNVDDKTLRDLTIDATFYNCKSKDCTVELPRLNKNTTVTFQLWHSDDAHIAGDLEIKSSGGKWSDPKDVLVQENIDFTFDIISGNDEPARLLVSRTTIDSPKSDWFEASEEIKKFVRDHNGTKIVITNPTAEESENFIIGPKHKAKNTNCYILESYIHEFEIASMSVSLESHTTTFSNRYELFNISGANVLSTNQIHFCLDEFLFFADSLFGTMESQFLISLQGTARQTSKLTTKFAMFDIKLDAKHTSNINTYPFLTEKHSSWARIFPQIETVVVNEHSAVQIAGKKTSQVIEMSTHWVANNEHLYDVDYPIYISLKTQGMSHSANSESLLDQLKLQVSVCDELSDCIKSELDTENKKSLDEHVLSFKFDRHPNKISSVMKLFLKAEVPSFDEAALLQVSLKTFGDPCFGDKDPCQNDGRQATCNRLNAIIPNDFSSACECDKANLCSGEEYLRPLCRANNSFECICKQVQDDKFLTWTEDSKCHHSSIIDFSKNNENTQFTWNYKFEPHHSENYDICIKLQSTEKDEAQIEVEALLKKDKLEFVRLFDTMKIKTIKQTEKLASFCLGDFVANNPTFWKDHHQLEVIVHSKTKLSLEKESLIIYGKDLPLEKKLPSKIKTFTARSIVPSNLVLQNDEDSNLFHFIKDTSDPFEIRFYGEWMKSYELSVEMLDQNKLITENAENWAQHFEICRPRQGKSDCVALKNNRKISSILNFLNSNVIQIVFVLTSGRNTTDLSKNSYPMGTISMWDACDLHEVSCKRNSRCSSPDDAIDEFDCKTDCPPDFGGKFCHLRVEESCTKERTNICAEHNSLCIPEENKQFRCDCPTGYKWNREQLTCQRMIVRDFHMTCETSKPEDCWLNSVLYDRFHSLPKHFPLLKREQTKDKDVLFTFTSGKKIEVSIENDRENEDKDYCVTFRYFLAPSSSIVVRLNEQHLTTLESNSLANTNALSLSQDTRLCLRSLVDFGTFTKVGKWSFEFEARIDSYGGAIVMELFQSFGRAYDINFFKPYEQPSTYLSFLSPTTKNQNASEDVLQQNALTYQWPVQFPNDGRLKIEESSFIFEAVHDTLNGFLLESSWLKRSIALARSVAGQVRFYFDFKIAGDDKSTPISIEVNLLNDKREIIERIGSLKGLTHIDSQEKRFELNGNVNIAPSTVYKIQLLITATDRTKVMPKFIISDLSFGDPCELMKKTQNYCKSPDADGKPINDMMNAKCSRIVQANGDVDFQCQCEGTLSGRLCSETDYCALEHSKVPIINETDSISEYDITGNDYCDRYAKCHNFPSIEEGARNFVCICEDKRQIFHPLRRYCHDLSECSLNLCNLQTQTCSHDKLSCVCRDGYHQVGKQCVRLPEKCNSTELCDDPLMNCRRDQRTGMPLCTCPIGFIESPDNQHKDKTYCRPIKCQFPLLNSCEHTCKDNINKTSHFECGCDNRYYEVEEKTVNNQVTYSCKLRNGVRDNCKNCKSEDFQICKPESNECACMNDFVKDSDGKCVPQDSFHLLSCPNGKVKIDDSKKRLVCDCDNSTLPYFQDQQGTCRLVKNACQNGEVGRKMCEARNAGCLPSPHDVAQFDCVCPFGKVFIENQPVFPGKVLARYPTWKCVDSCELPHIKHGCARTGQQCVMPLASLINNPTMKDLHLKPRCECVPGTFMIGDECYQEPNAISMNMTIQWTQNHQNVVNNVAWQLFESFGKRNLHTINDFMNLDIIDPDGYNSAVLEAHQQNLMMFKAYNQKIVSALTKTKLEELVQRIFYGFQVVKSVDDVRLARYTLDSSDETHQTANMQLSVRYPVDKNEFAGLIGHGEDNEEGIRKELIDAFKADLSTSIIPHCGVLKGTTDSDCVLPFVDQGTFVTFDFDKISMNLPCENAHHNCHGMSDCITLNGSYFECRCNLDYFDVEQAFSFKSIRANVHLKNELCLPKKLCPDACTLENQNCTQTKPEFDYVTSAWTAETKCECKDDFALSGGNCVAVCRIANCTKNGKCVHAAAHQAKCECEKGYYGERCENELPTNVVWIIVVSVLGVLSVVAIGAAIFFYIRFSSNKSASGSCPPLSVITQREHQQITQQQQLQQQQQNVQTSYFQHFHSEQRYEAHHQQSSNTTTTKTVSTEVIGDDDVNSGESFRNRIKNAIQPLNSYSPSKAERRILF